MLMLRNPLTFATVHGLGNIFMFLGKCTISAAVTFIGYLLITNMSYYSDELYSPIGPCIIYFLIGYVIGVLFMSVWAMSCDAVL